RGYSLNIFHHFQKINAFYFSSLFLHPSCITWDLPACTELQHGPPVQPSRSGAHVTRGKGQRMTEEGMLSIVLRGTTYQVRYASSNPHGLEWPPYPCPDEGTLVALLHQCGTDPWSIQQA